MTGNKLFSKVVIEFRSRHFWDGTTYVPSYDKDEKVWSLVEPEAKKE